MRDYQTPPVVYGGDKECEHEWESEKQTLSHENRNFITGSQEEARDKTGVAYIKKYDDRISGFCSKCGAWRGQLGLEPSPQMFIGHLVLVSEELKRVLKPQGSYWLSLGDTTGCEPKTKLRLKKDLTLEEEQYVIRELSRRGLL